MNIDKYETMRQEMSQVWKTDSAFLSWLRGGVRRSLWNRSPIKLKFIQDNRVKIPNPNPRGKVKEVWGGVCALTGETHILSNLEVDHVRGQHSLKSIDDIQSFIEGIVLVTQDDLQFVSKEAHKIKSYAEKHNMSFKQAKKHKEYINICKSKELLLDELKRHDIQSIPKTLKGQKELLKEIMFGG